MKQMQLNSSLETTTTMLNNTINRLEDNYHNLEKESEANLEMTKNEYIER